MGQPNWVSLSKPTFTNGFDWFNAGVGQNADGRLELFLLGFDGVLGHSWQLEPGKSSWSEWASLGQIPDATTGRAGYPLAVGNADGRLEVFAFETKADGSGQTLWHSWQLAPGTNDWSTWAQFGQPAGGITSVLLSVGQNADGRLEVFVTGADNAFWHSWQLTPAGTWGEWAALGKPPSSADLFSPAVASNADGRLELFVACSDGVLWHRWQLAPGTNSWSAWAQFGRPTTGVEDMGLAAVVSNVDGRLEVFATTVKAGGSGQALWHSRQLTPNGTWGEWAALSTTPVAIASTPTVGKNTDGRFELFVPDAHAVLWQSGQLAPGKNWSEWTSLGKPPDLQPGSWPVIPSPLVAENADGRLEVFLAGQTTFWHIWQLSPGGSWSN